MSDNMIQIPADFEDVRKEIWESDLILVRNRNGKCLEIAKAAWWDDELFAVSVRKYRGVVAIPLRQFVDRHPGRIDVFEVNPLSRRETYDRQNATRQLKSTVFSADECRRALLKTILGFFSETFGRAQAGSMTWGAEAVRLADRLGGGVEPLPELGDTPIEAADLESSPFYRYRFTLK